MRPPPEQWNQSAEPSVVKSWGSGSDSTHFRIANSTLVLPRPHLRFPVLRRLTFELGRGRTFFFSFLGGRGGKTTFNNRGPLNQSQDPELEKGLCNRGSYQ